MFTMLINAIAVLAAIAVGMVVMILIIAEKFPQEEVKFEDEDME